MKEVTKTDQLARLIDLSAQAISLTREDKRTGKEVSELLDTLQLFKERKPIFVPTDDIRSKLREWERFYKKHFNLRVDLSALVIPAKPVGFDRLLVIAEGITTNQVYAACDREFRAWRYADDDLDKAFLTNDRVSTTTYAIWVRDRVEADEELKNLSAGMLKDRGIAGETLLERLIHGLKYYDETAKHLDVENWTLCFGSRSRNGNVPRVGWCETGLAVRFFDPDSHGDHHRARQVAA